MPDKPTPPPKPRNEAPPLHETNIPPPKRNYPPPGEIPPTPDDGPTPPVYTGPPPRRPAPYTYGRRRRPVHLPGGEPSNRVPPDGKTQQTGPINGHQSSTHPPRRRPPGDRPMRPHPHHDRPPNPREIEEETPPPSIGRRPDGRRPKRRARRRTQMAAVYIFIIVAAVGITLTVFAMAFPRMFDPDREVYAAATPTPTPTPTPLPLNARELTGMITGITGQNITLMNITNNESRSYTLTEDTSVSNRFGNEMETEHLSVGHLMDVTYDPDTGQIFSLRQTFTRDIIPADFRVDIDNSTIAVGNDVFTFTSQTLILHQGLPFLLADISPDDTVTLVTLGGTIWLIDVAYGHGFLEFTNISDVLDGRVILDPLGQGMHRFANLEDRIALPEGSYRVTVEGRNIEAFITEVEILQGQTTTVNLADVEPSAAVLELTVSPGGSRVLINGALTSLHAAMEFEFGETVSLRVERDGYYTYERTVEMNQAIVSIHVTLEEETPEPEVGNLFIFSMPAGAQVWVNNQPIGMTPTSVELAPGVHTIAATLPGFNDYSTVVNISAGENSVTLIMDPITEDPPYQPIPTPPPEDPPEDPPWYPPPDDDPYYGDDD